MKTHTITQDDSEIRLDRWFKRHYPGMQHSLLEKQLRKGAIRLDGKKAKTSDRVAAGQQLSIQEAGFNIAEGSVQPRHLNAKDKEWVQRMVLYKDDNVIIVNKPYGLAVQGGTKIVQSMDDLLDGLMFELNQRPKLTHRIDKDTSGILVLARNARAATAITKLFSSGSGKPDKKGEARIDKTYWALVNGSPLPAVGYVDLPLNKLAKADSDREQVMVDEEDGKYARTEYRVLDSLARKFALIELKPLTGRMHQLRVHMAAIDCPIVGDHKYGGGMGEWGNSDAGSVGVENILHLHARRIVIPGILGGRKIDVSAPLPKHMVASFEALGLDVPKGG